MARYGTLHHMLLTLGDIVIATPTLIGLLLFAALIIGGLWSVRAYNLLVRDRNLMEEGFSGIDVQLKRRHDLVPMLLATVRGYATHESDVLREVTERRTRTQEATDRKARLDAENDLTEGLKRLFALSERYPDLKADGQFRELMHRLVQIEEHLQMARRYYNGATRNYNIRVEQFPSNLIARVGRFQQATFFEIESATERDTPRWPQNADPPA